MAVRLINKKTGKPVPDAVILPSGSTWLRTHGRNDAPLEQLPSTDPASTASRPTSAMARPLAAVAGAKVQGEDRHGRKQAGAQGAAMRRGARGVSMVLAALAAAETAAIEQGRRAYGWAAHRKPSCAPGVPGGESSIPAPRRQALLSAEPGKTADGRPYRAVHASEDIASIRYRQNPPIPPAGETRFSTTAIPWGCPTPRRCRRRTPWGWTTSRSMKGRAGRRPTVKVSLDKIQRIGVTTEKVEATHDRPCRAGGRHRACTTRSLLTIVTLRTDGYIEELYVNKTGQHVARASRCSASTVRQDPAAQSRSQRSAT